MVDNIKPDNTLDCRGLNCPMPLIKTRKTVDKMKSGEVLEVLSTDSGTKNDLPAFASRMGREYIGEKQDEGFSKFYLKVK